MFRPCLKAKYKFLREAVKVKRELQKYSELEVGENDMYKYSLRDKVHYAEASKVISKKWAIWTFGCNFRSVGELIDGGYEKAVRILDKLNEDKDYWGWDLQ
jgi:hypothetical protein